MSRPRQAFVGVALAAGVALALTLGVRPVLASGGTGYACGLWTLSSTSHYLACSTDEPPGQPAPTYSLDGGSPTTGGTVYNGSDCATSSPTCLMIPIGTATPSTVTITYGSLTASTTVGEAPGGAPPTYTPSATTTTTSSSTTTTTTAPTTTTTLPPGSAVTSDEFESFRSQVVFALGVGLFFASARFVQTMGGKR